MARNCKIICTLGPASDDEAMIAKMTSHGMNVVRINSSHGTEAQNQKMIDIIRLVNKKHKYDMTILQDLTGYRIRVGILRAKKLLSHNQTVYMSNESERGEDHIP